MYNCWVSLRNSILSYPLLHQRRINIFQQNYKIFGEFSLYHSETITTICLISLSMDFIYCPPIRNHIQVGHKNPQKRQAKNNKKNHITNPTPHQRTLDLT